MYIQDNHLYYEDFIFELQKSDKDQDVFLYFIKEGARTDNNVIYEVHQGTNPYTPEDENHVFVGSVLYPGDPELILIARKKELIQHLLSKTDTISAELKKEYSLLEERSWEAQEAEARSLLAVKTPIISALCAARGCSRDFLAQRIIENADAARNAGIKILSWQQETEEKIKDMSLEEFTSMWKYIEDKIM